MSELVGDPEIDAMYRCVTLCINACRCPTCGAQADTQCRSSSGRVVPHHSSRTKAGHALLATPLDAINDRAIKHYLSQP